jgi:thiamine pyrophosphokinase
VLVVGAAWAPGRDDFYAALAARHDLVIAADAAAERLQASGVMPDLAVGDFDSAQPGAPRRLREAGVMVREFPAAKDETDLDLAADEARAAGATSVTLTGAFRDRLDHTLAALGALGRLADLEAVAVEPDLRIWTLSGTARPSLELALAPRTVVSAFSLDGTATGVSLRGFRYPLEDAVLEPMSGFGVSNVVEASTQRAGLKTGTLLLMAVV